MTPGVHRGIHLIVSLLVAMILALTPVLLTSWGALANTATIDDQAHVLDVNQVQAEAAKLSAAVFIYTTKTFTGDQDALNQDARSRLPNQQTIDIGVDTVNRNVSVQAGSGVKISNDQAQNAADAFISQFQARGYSGATIAALDSLQAALTGSAPTNQGEMTPAGKVVAGILLIFSLLLIVLGVRSYPRYRKNLARRGSLSSGSSSNDMLVSSWWSQSHHSGSHSSSWHSGGSSGDFGGGGDSGGGGGGHF